MPILKNPKHEVFAQELAKGRTADEAAASSGIDLLPCRSLQRFYVYLLIDPRDGVPFYVGKGTKNRSEGHVKEWQRGSVVNASKFERIGDIHRSGFKVRTVCLIDDLGEDDALDTERWLISAIGIDRLTNLIRGEQSDTDRINAMVRDYASRIVPFAAWKSEVLPSLETRGNDPVKMTEFYWKIVEVIVRHLRNNEYKCAAA